MKIRISGLFKALERWASESEERSRLVIILVWAGFGVAVLLAVGIAALIMLPPDSKPF